MIRRSILILYSLPNPFLPDGSVDIFGPKSVLLRLQAVKEALQTRGYAIKTLRMEKELSPMVGKILRSGADLIFNLCEEFHGQTRMEMNVAALLELLYIPFTGSSALVLGLSQDKGKTKFILAHYGIPTPPFVIWPPGEKVSTSRLRKPLFVKPLREDASLGIGNDAIARNSFSLRANVDRIHRLHHQPALVEEYIEGRELNVSILGNEAPQVLPISEIDFSTLPKGLPKICGYAAKWVENSPEFHHTIPLCPASLPLKLEKRVREVALQAYRAMECRDYGRVDIRLSPEGIPYVLEVNANPDISPDAGMTRSAKAAGLAYPEMIGRIAELAWARARSSKFLPEDTAHES
ncbi:MAG: ATP-grasp domain-containing protein [Syntrophaceae bacterium]|jgi:D-alanine-D-alanine ligase|nr:ATP-grasp domain-containing protein [Syntrophaceae bacterium]